MNEEDIKRTLSDIGNVAINSREDRALLLDQIATYYFSLAGVPVEIFEQAVEAEEAYGPESLDKELSEWQIQMAKDAGFSQRDAIIEANRQREQILRAVKQVIRAKRNGYFNVYEGQ